MYKKRCKQHVKISLSEALFWIYNQNRTKPNIWKQEFIRTEGVDRCTMYDIYILWAGAIDFPQRYRKPAKILFRWYSTNCFFWNSNIGVIFVMHDYNSVSATVTLQIWIDCIFVYTFLSAATLLHVLSLTINWTIFNLGLFLNCILSYFWFINPIC